MTSFKIEGRMKRPEYVAAAVTACRKVLAGERPDMAQLKEVFSRGGFTDGYFYGKRNLSMYGRRDKEDVEATAKVLGSISELYRHEFPKIPVRMELTVQEGMAMLRAEDPAHAVTVQGDVPAAAPERRIDRDYAARFLQKTGGTPFYAEDIRVQAAPGLMLSAAALNGMRRDALEQLYQKRCTVLPHAFIPDAEKEKEPHQATERAVHIRFESWEQLFPNKADRIILPIGEIEKHPEVLSSYGDKLVGELPELVFPGTEEAFARRLHRLRGMGLQAVLGDNLGMLFAAKAEGYRLHGGAGLNIANTEALTAYEKLGLADVTLSIELSAGKIRQLKGTLPRGILYYGYLPLMRLRTCPAQGKGGCGDCRGRPHLTDRKGISFPMLCRNKQYTVIFNCVPLNVAGKTIDNVDFITLYYTMESREEAKRIYHSVLSDKPEGQSFTRGLYFREVQ